MVSSDAIAVRSGRADQQWRLEHEKKCARMTSKFGEW